ncbi:MAG TPA: addiction module protein [Chryseosolibacter sp.]
MSVSKIREELHLLIDKVDEDTLNWIYGMIKIEEERMPLTEEQRLELDQRISRHERGESKSYTWEETLKLIKEQK